MTVLAPYLTAQFFNNQGQPNVGGLLYSYAAGTSTPLATYTDNTGVTQNPNPVFLNYRGEVPAIWVNPNVAYKFILEDNQGNIIRPAITSSIASL